MSKKNPQYMLFVYGDVSEHGTNVEEIAFQLIPVITSENLKYTYGENGVVFNFRSDYEFEELKDFVDMVLAIFTDQYFLVEIGKNFDVKMPKKLKKDFLNIDGQVKKEENKNGTLNVREASTEIPKKLEPTISMFFPLFAPGEFIEKEKPLSVDEILEKISEKGIESLTKEEKEKLDNYGKRKNRGQ